MKKNIMTELVFILDKSGSMSGLERDTMGGFNAFIEKQKKEEGEALVSTVLFNNNRVVIHDRLSLDQIPKLTDREYLCGGTTALLDAVGSSINYIKNAQKYGDKKVEKTIFIITTDGYENASTEYSYHKIKRMISEQREKKDWDFIFLGANIDVRAESEKLGLCEEDVVEYACDSQGIDLNYRVLSDTVAMRRKNEGKIDKTWKKKIQEDCKGRK